MRRPSIRKRVITADDGLRMAVGEMQTRIADAEKAARDRLRVAQRDGLNWFGCFPEAVRGDKREIDGHSTKARPGVTYRGARRNAARARHWPARIKIRGGLYGGITGGGRKVA